MKKYSFLAAGLFLLSACNVSVEKTETKTETTQEPAAAGQEKTAKVTDPVCGMEKGSDWTEYSVNGKDTTWFCSPHCKESFAKNPEKYQGKKQEQKG